MVKVRNWLLGSAASLLLGCVEVPVNALNPPPSNRDGGTDAGGDLGTSNAPTWRWESPQPQGNNLRALWGIPGATSDQDLIYGGGDNGTLMVGGSTGWKLQSAGSQSAILAIAGLPASGQGSSAQVLAVGFYDLALRQAGNSWLNVSPLIGTGDGALTSAWATPAVGEYFVVGTTGRIYHVLGSGNNWAREGGTVTTDSLFGVTGSGSGQGLDVYAVGANGRIVHRLGGTWMVEANNMTSSQLNGVWIGDGAATGEVFAVGDNATVLHRQGSGWTAETPPGTAQLNAVWGSGSDIFAVGAAGSIVHRTGPNSWQAEGVGLTGELLTALWGSVHNGQITVYAAGNFGTILRRTGTSWQSLSSRVTSTTLSSVWARNFSEVYAAGGGGLILQRSGTTAQGSWTTVASGVTTQTLSAISGWAASSTGDADVYAVGTTGTIVRKSGSNWAIDGGFLTNADLNAVWVGNDSVWVVGLGGRMYHRTQGKWNIESGPMMKAVNSDLFATWGTGSGAGEVVYVVGDVGLILRHDMLGWTQEATTLTTDRLIALFGTNEDNLYAFSNKGGVFRRLGGQWQTVDISPISQGMNGVAGCVIPGTADLLAVGDQGTVLRRNNGTWTPETSLTVLPYGGVAAAALNDYYIVGSNGLILHKY